MERRTFFAGTLSLLAAPLATEAQTPGHVARVGVIDPGGGRSVVVDGLRQGLRELGLEEGTHVVLDLRTARDVTAVEEAARALERGRVDLIYTVLTSATIAANRATVQTPIVFSVGSDPIAAGLVESLAKPGGRLTGVYRLSADLTAKRMELLKEMLPKLRRVVTFYDPGNAISRENARRSREAAHQFGVQLLERHVSSVAELRQGLRDLKPGDVDAYFNNGDALVGAQADLIIDAARGKRLATMFIDVDLVARGALVSFGISFRESGRLSAKHVQRILAGTPPKDLPVENVSKVELALNLKTAKALGLTIPPSVLARADEVIHP